MGKERGRGEERGEGGGWKFRLLRAIDWRGGGEQEGGGEGGIDRRSGMGQEGE